MIDIAYPHSRPRRRPAISMREDAFKSIQDCDSCFPAATVDSRTETLPDISEGVAEVEDGPTPEDVEGATGDCTEAENGDSFPMGDCESFRRGRGHPKMGTGSVVVRNVGYNFSGTDHFRISYGRHAISGQKEYTLYNGNKKGEVAIARCVQGEQDPFLYTVYGRLEQNSCRDSKGKRVGCNSAACCRPLLVVQDMNPHSFVQTKSYKLMPISRAALARRGSQQLGEPYRINVTTAPASRIDGRCDFAASPLVPASTARKVLASDPQSRNWNMRVEADVDPAMMLCFAVLLDHRKPTHVMSAAETPQSQKRSWVARAG